MKDFNPELNKDITRLKELHAKKDKTDFKGFKAELMLRHNISKATVYREMKKEFPGLYKTPQYRPPQRAITERETAMVRELLYKKIPVMDIPRIMEAETGEKYNWDRIDNIRRIIDARIKEEEEKAKKISEAKEISKTKSNDDTSVPLVHEKPPLVYERPPLANEFESSFGSELRRVVEAALKIDRMAPNAYVEIDIYGRKHRLSYGEAKDIALICMNSWERMQAGYYEGTTYVREKVWYLFEQKISSITSGAAVPVRELLDLKKAHDDLMKDFDVWLARHFAVIYFTAQELTDKKADFSLVYSLAQKYSRLYPECAPAKCPCYEILEAMYETSDVKSQT